jgi:hypothetical protein
LRRKRSLNRTQSKRKKSRRRLMRQSRLNLKIKSPFSKNLIKLRRRKRRKLKKIELRLKANLSIQ